MSKTFAALGTALSIFTADVDVAAKPPKAPKADIVVINEFAAVGSTAEQKCIFVEARDLPEGEKTIDLRAASQAVRDKITCALVFVCEDDEKLNKKVCRFPTLKEARANLKASLPEDVITGTAQEVEEIWHHPVEQI